MNLNKKNSWLFCRKLAGIISLFVLQSVWIYQTYQLEHNRIMTELREAFALAYEKEQTYRIPVVDILNPGEVSIQSCGNEEIIIVRKCSDADTIVYNNLSGRSIEKFINLVFGDLRESIVPMNLFCLSDLFGGMLHDKDIPASFVIERYHIDTNSILETTLFPDQPQQAGTKYENIIRLEISDTEAVRAILQLTPGIVFRNMAGTLIGTAFLSIIILVCIIRSHKPVKQNKNTPSTLEPIEQVPTDTFPIGEYNFNPFKNELQGFGETIQLNKKENSILHALCLRQGNVVERNSLLEENWGSSGIVYSRSLDTYLASLRKYLKKDPNIQIVTVKGVGYKLVYTTDTIS